MKIEVRQHPTRLGFLEVKFPYHESLVKVLGKCPGAIWDKRAYSWAVPQEMLGLISKTHKARVGSVPEDWERRLNPNLMWYQKKDVLNIGANKRWILAYDMGVGKSAPTIEAMRLSNASRVLIVTPSRGICSHWVEDEIPKWWPNSPPVYPLIANKPFRYDGGPGIVVTTYGMLHHLEASKVWDFIVIDEAHSLQSSTSKRSKNMRDMLDRHPGYVVALTGTPITTEPMSVHNLVNTLWPLRFGTYGKFCSRYCNIVPCEFADSGEKFEGINPDNADELSYRFASMGSRVTKQQVQHLFKSMSFKVRQLARSDSKIEYLRESIAESFEGHSHICVATYHIDEARQYYKALKDDFPCTLVTGQSNRRTEVIAEAKLEDKNVLVCSMKSVGTGIDLTRWTKILLAEMYTSPSTILQFLGRFNRLSSTLPASGEFVVYEGTEEEQQASLLKDRVDAISQIIGASAGEKMIQDAFTLSPEEEKALLDKLRTMLR